MDSEATAPPTRTWTCNGHMEKKRETEKGEAELFQTEASSAEKHAEMYSKKLNAPAAKAAVDKALLILQGKSAMNAGIHQEDGNQGHDCQQGEAKKGNIAA